MTNFELKCLMSAIIVAGHRANETPDYQFTDSKTLAKTAVFDAEAVLALVVSRDPAVTDPTLQAISASSPYNRGIK